MALKILFVYPLLPPRPEVYHGYHHGLGGLSALLKAQGHETSLLATHTCDGDIVERILKKESPDVVAITATSADFPLARALAGKIVECRPLPLYFGGIHATLVPEEIFLMKGVWGLCRGEGEEGFPLVIEALDKGRPLKDIPGFWFPEGNQWVLSAPARPASLTALPFADRELFDYAQWVRPFHQIMGSEFLAGRGCPFRCSYCCAPQLNDLYKPRHYLRRRPVADLLAEIKQVLNNYPFFKIVGFHDDIFTLDKEWLSDFCRQYAKQIAKPFWCNTRVGCITAEEAQMLRHAGCIRIHLGVETGNLHLRRKVLNRSISDEDIIDTFAFIKRAGIKRLAFNMLGVPFETEETIRETIALNRKIQPERIHVTLFQPYPGTALFQFCKDNNLLEDAGPESYYEAATRVRNPDLPKEVLFRYLRDFVSLVYGG